MPKIIHQKSDFSVDIPHWNPSKDGVFEGELDQADFEHQMEDAEVAL